MSSMQTLRAKLTESRKAGRPVELSVLQVVLGEAMTAEARAGKPPSDEEVEKILLVPGVRAAFGFQRCNALDDVGSSGLALCERRQRHVNRQQRSDWNQSDE